MKSFKIDNLSMGEEVYNNRTFQLVKCVEGLAKVNNGELKEYSLRVALTGDQPYYKDSSSHKIDSDIKTADKNISVKSGEAGLGFMDNENLIEYIEKFLKEDYSNVYMYVTNDFTVYEMDKDEMREFLKANARVSKTINKRTNAVKYECRLKRDTTICKWLAQ